MSIPVPVSIPVPIPIPVYCALPCGAAGIFLPRQGWALSPLYKTTVLRLLHAKNNHFSAEATPYSDKTFHQLV